MRDVERTEGLAERRKNARALDYPPPRDGRARVLVADVRPRVDGGRYAVKRCFGDELRIEADLVADGHDSVAGVLRYRRPNTTTWAQAPLAAAGNDAFRTSILLDTIGTWEIAIEGWVDDLATWRHTIERQHEVDDVDDIDLAIGAQLVREAAERAAERNANDTRALRAAAERIEDPDLPPAERVAAALDPRWIELASRHPNRSHASRSEPFAVVVDPVHARFASWYELFIRSTGDKGAHGTFRSAEGWLPYIASMGFDVVYLPPIHPIGRTFRKGRNNTADAGPDDPGSPWAIGSSEGGHTAIHHALGSLADFEHFVERARAQGLSIALDVAFQASPDHPWVREHPEFFRKRPDGTIQCAENPPKKYQDVYPFDFECAEWEKLWTMLRDVLLFWIGRGVTIFRVDNPHTKPIAFWQWCIGSIKAAHPNVTFLAEAFTRPKLKYALAKVGFSQGYTYFTWRHTPRELRDYFTELTTTPIADYFRPSLWPNTPDILPEDLQHGGRAAFLARLFLAGTLSSHYGIYGPAFELMEHACRPGSEEYLDNEKYEVRSWDRNAPHTLRMVIALLNTIRRAHPALQRNDTLRFHDCDNASMICYSKSAGEDVVLTIVSLDYHNRQRACITLDLAALGLAEHEHFQVHDILGDVTYLWKGARNLVEIDPVEMPVQILVLRRSVRTEHDFDYFM